MPHTWDVWGGWGICPKCQPRVKADGGVADVRFGAYANGKPKPGFEKPNSERLRELSQIDARCNAIGLARADEILVERL
ncbi:hypothetical protein LCGC14_1974010, partial [marine sediment metagenome]